jgi:hypothetical protein
MAPHDPDEIENPGAGPTSDDEVGRRDKGDDEFEEVDDIEETDEDEDRESVES